MESGHIDGSERGVWKLTEEGSARVLDAKRARKNGRLRQVPPIEPLGRSGLRDLVNENHAETESRLLSELRALSPRAFEHFCRELLSQFGFRNVEVTRRSHDGGLDGHGDFRQGVISIRSAFQAKRYADTTVGRPEIDRFRGAIQGDFDHGVFLTTSRFSKEAVQTSFRKGAITILLLDGNAIADLLLERGLGVRSIPVYLYDVDAEFFDLPDE